MDKIPFFSMFSAVVPENGLKPLLEDALVLGAEIDREARRMRLNLSFSRAPKPDELELIRQSIAFSYGLNAVDITQNNSAPRPQEPPISDRVPPPEPERVPPPDDSQAPPEDPFAAAERIRRQAMSAMAKAAPAEKAKRRLIYGSVPKGKLMEISAVGVDTGRVTVCGDIFSLETKELTRRNAVVISFGLTDYTGSVKVSKLLDAKDAEPVVKALKVGMRVKVQGRVNITSFEPGGYLEPTGVYEEDKPERADEAGEKRVELHLHTQMSALDALTDTAAAVKRAIKWGHRAIAITDHGVAQAFPDAMKAAGDKIKILYGCEAYYINDVDDRLCVLGDGSCALDDEFVAFDIETTGLSSITESITEIGAILFRGGVEAERFQTFVDPGKPIPYEISRLTGIRDEDVSGAPSQREAVKAFLEFAAGKPLAAHNAPFDLGFMTRVCEEAGMEFDPICFDTLPIAQALLPELKHYKLDNVAQFLGLPDFQHHRASDDAATTGLMLAALLKRVPDKNVKTSSELNESLQAKRGEIRSKRRAKHIILLAKDQTGIKNLYRLITKSHLEHYRRNPIIPKSLLLQYREGLIIGSACEAGELFTAVVEHKSDRELRRIASFYDYLEIQPICNNMFMLTGDRPKAASVEELQSFNRRVLELGKSMGKPVAATGDVHFLDPEDEIYRHVLLTAKGFEDADKKLPLFFRTTAEMLEEFSYLGEKDAYDVVVKYPNLIADMCETTRPLPPKKLFAPVIENSAGQLKDLVYGRMHELYGENPPELIQQRVDTEMRDILERKYDVIYMSAQKLVSDSLAHGYLVGSRGSVGSSLVAYMSGITEVNSLAPHYRCPGCKFSDFESGKGFGCGADMPDKDCPVCGAALEKEGFDIPFETFLGFGGSKVPDIDLNFSGEYQANAHRYTTELFGRDHVFRAGTIGTIAEKTAYGYVKKYAEIRGVTLSRAEESRLALGCVGVKRTTGQHPGGLVVIPQTMEIADFCPAQHPADDPSTDIITTHFEYHCMEDNLLKLDELGHDDPTMIKMLEDMTGVSARKIPLGEKKTMRIFSSPDALGLPDDDDIIGKTGTIGIPEFGTGFTRQMLADTLPEKFDTLVRLSGYSHGTGVWLGNARDIIFDKVADISETIGCRDDIMLYLISAGMDEMTSFKIMEAVRKGKGLTPEWIAAMKATGVPDWYVESCQKISYLFPKAHAVAYVIMAFRIAWFKVYKPLAFYSAYFYRRSQKDSFDVTMMCFGVDKVRSRLRAIRDDPNSSQKDDDLAVTLEACYEFYMRGFTFERLDIYKSDATRFLIEGDKLIPPLVSVPGLGAAAAQDIADSRVGETFLSIEEFSLKCQKVSKSHIEKLRDAGALGDLPETSQLSLF